MARTAKSRDISTATGSEIPELDLSSLTPVEVKVEAVKRTTGSKYQNSPAMTWLADSFKAKKAMQVTVPAANVPQLKATIRACSALLHLGHRFGDDKTVDGMTTVTFAAVEPKRTRRQIEREAAQQQSEFNAGYVPE